jgi:hypothetical protein
MNLLDDSTLATRIRAPRARVAPPHARASRHIARSTHHLTIATVVARRIAHTHPRAPAFASRSRAPPTPRRHVDEPRRATRARRPARDARTRRRATRVSSRARLRSSATETRDETHLDEDERAKKCGRDGLKLVLGLDALATTVRGACIARVAVPALQNVGSVTETIARIDDVDRDDAVGATARVAEKRDAARDSREGSVSRQRLEVRQRVLRFSRPLVAAGFERFDHLPHLRLRRRGAGSKEIGEGAFGERVEARSTIRREQRGVRSRWHRSDEIVVADEGGDVAL